MKPGRFGDIPKVRDEYWTRCGLPDLRPSEAVMFNADGHAVGMKFKEDEYGVIEGVFTEVEPPDLTKAEKKAGRPKLRDTLGIAPVFPTKNYVVTKYTPHAKQIMRDHQEWYKVRHNVLNARAMQVLGGRPFRFSTPKSTIFFFFAWLANLLVFMEVGNYNEHSNVAQVWYTILFFSGIILFIIFIGSLALGLAPPWSIVAKDEKTKARLREKRS